MAVAGLATAGQLLVVCLEHSCSYSKARSNSEHKPPSRGFSSLGALRFCNDERRGRRRGSSRASGIRADARRDSEQHMRDQQHEIRVCINKTCRKSGSLETLDVIRSLAPPNVTVESCSCIGKCGNGPNLVILPAEMMVSHCNTAAHAARLLALQCGASDPENNLKALDLKQQANKAFERGSLLEAEQLYTQAIELNPSGGLHFIYANRSALKLAQGNFQGALQDAQEAERIAPKWAQAFVRQADALSGMGEVESALNALSTALRLDPLLRRSKGFQAKTRDLQSKLATASAST
ncbi:hypothetical protein KC19_3G249100 [Ceratodon purpureus]|uniref:Uncharacterized protein n=1 Tax=Ceratodon purpureus TaxID=3225 RepID=A0A8T0IQB7_CERPU|nr:hypothetical protein KC19_3G249100 [Ceratodon purpureus]